MEKRKIIKELFLKYRKFFISPLIVAIIILTIYAIKGIFPFGTMTIANGDMAQSYMTFYHFFYDIFYNGKSVFYDYTLGMGSNMYGGFMIDGLLNPSTFIILLSSRQNVAYMFSIILIIKVGFIALTSYILFNKLFKNNNYYNIIFSILYALSGYVLMYNTNIMWLDIVGLFPLFILSIKYMFETNKIYWYSIILALMLIFNYNLAYMILMFIIFIIPIYIIFGLPKEKRKKAIFDVMIGTILSVGISAFAFIPSFIQVMTSYRMSGVTVNTVENENILFKIVVFIFYSLPVYGFINWLKHYKKDKKEILIYGLALTFSAIIPILFERVNLLWHTGSYQMFPFRYGFIPTLILYLGALRYYNNYEKSEKRDLNIWEMTQIIAVVLFICAIITGIINGININRSSPAFVMNLSHFMGMFISAMFMILTIKSISYAENEKIRKIILTIIVISETLIYTYAYVGVDEEYRGGAEWSDEGIFTSYEIANTFNIENTLYRIKDLTYSTTENCPLVYNIPSMSTFLHLINTEQVINCEQLGYSHNKTKINDYGGTILSDAVYGIKYVLSKIELSQEIYNYVGTTESGIKLYEYKNNLPIGIEFENKIVDIPEELDVYEAQNYLYRNLFNKQEDIIQKINNETSIFNAVEQEKGKKITIKVEGKKALYVYSEINYIIREISINGEKLIVPILNDKENTIYPNLYNNGILDLGVFENETVEIDLNAFGSSVLDDIHFAILDIEKYNEIFEENTSDINVQIEANKIKITGYSDKDTNIFIPINYDKGWKIYKSNQESSIERVYNNFVGVKINQGENEIELRFTPYLYKESVIATIATIVLMIIMYFVRKKFNIRNVKWLMNIFCILGIVGYVGCVFKFYIMSIINTFMQ